MVFLNVLCSGVIFAEPFNAALVSSEAGWVLHADYDAFRQTALASGLRAKLDQRGLEQKMEIFRRIFSFHPIDDVRSVLIYGTDTDPNNATVLITARFDKDALLTLLEKPKTFAHNQHTIHSWESRHGHRKGQREYGAFYGQDRIVMAATMEKVKKVLDILDGKEANASGNSLMPSAKPVQGRFLYVQADSLGKLVENNPSTVMLRQTGRLLLTVSENNGVLEIRADMAVPSTQKVAEIEQVLRGILAYGQLATEQKKPSLASLISAVRIEPGQNVLSVIFSYDSKELTELLDKVAPKDIEQVKISAR